MLKLFKPTFENFVENYTGSIKNKFLSAIDGGKTKFVFNGPSGVGKNFLAEALAISRGFSIEKINVYTIEGDEKEGVSEKMADTIKNAAISTSLFGDSKKIVYIEDAEKVLSVDQTIFKKMSSVPGIIIFESVSGDVFKSRYRSALSGYEMIRFYKLNSKTVRSYISRLQALNKLVLDYEVVDELVRNSKGNLSSVISDLNMLLIAGNSSKVYPRYSEDSIFTQLSSVLSGDTGNTNVYFASDMEAKNFEIWLSDKAPLAVKGERLYKFFERLSNADIVLNKIKKQNWGLLRYVQSLLVFGTSLNSSSTPVEITYTAPDWNTYYRAE